MTARLCNYIERCSPRTKKRLLLARRISEMASNGVSLKEMSLVLSEEYRKKISTSSICKAAALNGITLNKQGGSKRITVVARKRVCDNLELLKLETGLPESEIVTKIVDTALFDLAFFKKTFGFSIRANKEARKTAALEASRARVLALKNKRINSARASARRFFENKSQGAAA